MSLVLVCPSTRDAVERRGRRPGAGRRAAIGGATGGVGQDEPEHGRHVRADHRRPLGEPGDA